MSQLRQPGDYLKHNMARTQQPRVHTFTAETNQKRRKNSSSKEQFEHRQQRVQTSSVQGTKRTSSVHSTTEESCTQITGENRRVK